MAIMEHTQVIAVTDRGFCKKAMERFKKLPNGPALTHTTLNPTKKWSKIPCIPERFRRYLEKNLQGAKALTAHFSHGAYSSQYIVL